MKTQFADSTKVVEFVPHILDLKRILVPVDFSETSKKAFLYALKFAEQFSCEITLLILVQPMSPMVGAPLAVEAFSDAEDEFSEGKEAWPCSRPSHTLTARILLIRASASDMRPTRSPKLPRIWI